MLKQISNDQYDAIRLWYLVQHSLSAFHKLETHFGSIAKALQAENLNRWSEAKIHKNHLERASEFFTALGQSKF